MDRPLLIVFVKNAIHGKVKTRLAHSIGNDAAFEVYKHLLSITERETSQVENCEIHIYFSDHVYEESWPTATKFVQQGDDLGKRMLNAFQDGFNAGYGPIVGIGSDLPDISSEIITSGLEVLNTNDFVFGPALDGGYYLIGMRELLPFVFENKEWSTEGLLAETLEEIEQKQKKAATLQPLNDIDTIEDLRNSSIGHLFNFS